MGLALLVRDVRREAAYVRRVPENRAWQDLHERVVSFAKRRAGLEWEEGCLLREARRAGVHRRLGFASFSEYVERIFGYNGRLVKEKLRVADELVELPLTSDALRGGELSWSAVRELVRVSTGETERAWLDAARGLTVRQVEELVSGRAPGDLPSAPADPKLRRHVLRFEVTSETRALWLEAVVKLRRDAGGSLDDDDVLLLMARQILAGRADAVGDPNLAQGSDGRASYQVQVTLCKSCHRGEETGNGERHAIGPAVVEMSLCDAQLIGEGVSTEEGETPVGQVAMSSTSTHPGHMTQRATQTIPPALRRRVVRRDNHRCVVNGCRHAMFVDVHHLTPRAEAGRHEMENLVCMCAAHHRAVHDGRLIVEGTPSSGLMFKHSDGTPYGSFTESCSRGRERCHVDSEPD